MRLLTLGVMTVLFSFLLAGCAAQEEYTTYDGAITQLDRLHQRYQVGLLGAPESREAIASMQADLGAFERKVAQNDETAPVLLLVDFRQKLLESDDLLVEGFKWGEASTTDPGFGCRKGSERILNSSALRSGSAEAGYEALELLREFREMYPGEAEQVGLTQKDVLELNANFKVIEEQAAKDKHVVENFCFNGTAQ